MKLYSVVPADEVDNWISEDEESEEGSECESSDDDDLFTRVFKCSKCDESFPEKEQLRIHVRKEHPKIRPQQKSDGGRERRESCNNGSVSGGGDAGALRKPKRSYEDSASAGNNSEEKAHDEGHGGSTPKQNIDEEPLSKRCRVLLDRLQCFHVEVSTPSEGMREILYKVESKSVSSPKSQTNSGSSGSSFKYFDYRQVQVKALVKRLKPPEPPSVPKRNSSDLPSLDSSRPCSDEKRNKSLVLNLPFENFTMINVNGLKEDVHSVLDIITGYKMSTVVIDAYMSLLLDSYNNEINAGIRSAYKLRPISSTQFRYLSVHFLPVFKKDDRPMSLQPDLNLLPKPPLDDDCVLIAPLFTCNHFYLAVFNCYTKSVYVYDSSWRFVPYTLRADQVKKVLISVFPESTSSWNVFFELDCAQQIDEFSCGCYVIYFTENHLKSKSHRNKRNLNKAEIVQIRTDIVIDLLSTTKTGKQFLEAITE